MAWVIISVFKASIVRLLFAAHSFVAIWRLTDETGNNRYWGLAFLLLLLLFEGFFIIVKRKGEEWKWVSVSVFLYLLSVVPAIWFLELDRIDKYNDGLEANINGTNSTLEDEIEEGLSDFAGVRIPLKLSSDVWLGSIEQLLVFILILGRWLLPKGKLSHEELSLLLFVYVGIGSDIMELLVLFEEDYVLQDQTVVYITLIIWSASLWQFVIVITATKARRSRGAHPEEQLEGPSTCLCCATEIWSIMATLLLQDVPFLSLRLYVMIKNKTISYTILFFTLKNTLLVLVQGYRIWVLLGGKDNKKQSLPYLVPKQTYLDKALPNYIPKAVVHSNNYTPYPRRMVPVVYQ